MNLLALSALQLKALAVTAAGITVAAGVGAVVVLNLEPEPAAPANSTQPQQLALVEPARKSTAEPAARAEPPAPAEKPSTEPAPPAAQEPAAPPPAQEAAPPPAEPPAFELIRIEPNGDGVFAGRAEPGAKVQLLANGEFIGEALSDATGSWAIVIDKPLPVGATELWLKALKEGGDGLRSTDTLAVVIEAGHKETPLAVLSSQSGPSKVVQKPEDKPAEQQVAAVEPPKSAQPERAEEPRPAPPEAKREEPAPEPEPAKAAEAPAEQPRPAEEERPAEPQPTEQQVAAVEPPRSAEPAAEAPKPEPARISPVSIEAADYAPDRRLHISGTATPGAAMRLYYDNRHLGDTVADTAGAWALSAGRDLDGGVHAIRADHVDAGNGEVLARAEVSFIASLPDSQTRQVASAPEEKAAPEPARPASATTGAVATGGDSPSMTGEGQTAPAPGGDAPRVASAEPPKPATAPSGPNKIVVRKGDNLWRLSREHYGSGIRYTTIYKANKDQIRDPHWIYPEQVFLLPRALGESAAAAQPPAVQ